LKSLKPKKQKQKSLTALKAELWVLCRILTALRYGGNDCYTCPATRLRGSNRQLAHFIPSIDGGLYLRYDLRNLRYCCNRCNVYLSGNIASYYQRLLKDIGQEAIDGIFADKKRPVENERAFVVGKIAEYYQLWLQS